MEIEFYSEANGMAVLRVNRPAQRNALNWAAQAAFAQAVTAAAQDETIRVLVITGTGNKAFVSGGDLKELSRHPETAAGVRLNQGMSAALMALTRLPFPVIGAVNGDVFGGGCEILTACDLCLSVPQARFCFAQVKNGLTTGWGGTGRLVRRLGQSRALDLLLTGRVFPAAEAQQLGLVHRLTADGEDLMTAVGQWAAELMALPRQALAAIKTLVYGAAQASPAEAGAQEAALFTHLWSQPDHLEAMAAFVAKRRPRFNQS